MTRLLTKSTLERENLASSGTPGVSQENCCYGFTPAFLDTETGQVEISCFPNGRPAPMHVIEGLPDNWIVERDLSSRATAIKQSVVSGFVRDGRFYTRSQATEAVLSESAC
jgi:hypothetical protein